MTPEQALQILDRASALAAMPRQDHVAVWLAAQAEPFGTRLLAKLYPAPVPKPLVTESI